MHPAPGRRYVLLSAHPSSSHAAGSPEDCYVALRPVYVVMEHNEAPAPDVAPRKRRRRPDPLPPVLEYVGPSVVAEDSLPKVDNSKFITGSIMTTGSVRRAMERFQVPQGGEVTDVKRRLDADGRADLTGLSCKVCKRRFPSLKVLAYHLSFAHVTRRVYSGPSTCVVCGTVCKNSLGILSHIRSAHRDLISDHERVCFNQKLLSRPDS